MYTTSAVMKRKENNRMNEGLRASVFSSYAHAIEILKGLIKISSFSNARVSE
jgi:hypothetical protein